MKSITIEINKEEVAFNEKKLKSEELEGLFQRFKIKGPGFFESWRGSRGKKVLRC